jgi:hypothetical protein
METKSDWLTRGGSDSIAGSAELKRNRIHQVFVNPLVYRCDTETFATLGALAAFRRTRAVLRCP